MSHGEIASALIKIRGAWFDIHIDPDYDANPKEADCYSPADIEAWSRDKWRYVCVTVALHDHPTVSDSLWGVEWGEGEGFRIDMSKIINEHPVPDMIGTLRAQLAKILADWEE